MTARSVLLWAGVLGAIGVGAGAFGAHALKGSVPTTDLEIWRTAAHYQQVHAAVLVGLAAWLHQRPHRLLAAAAAAFVAGMLVFSGSLYAMVLGGPRALGAVTPLGGLGLIAGWCLIAVAAGKLARTA